MTLFPRKTSLHFFPRRLSISCVHEAFYTDVANVWRSLFIAPAVCILFVLSHIFSPRLRFVLYCCDIFVFAIMLFILFFLGYLQSAIILGSFHSVYCMWCVLNLQYGFLFSFFPFFNRLVPIVSFFFGWQQKMPWWLCSILNGFLEHWALNISFLCITYKNAIGKMSHFLIRKRERTIATLGNINW